MLTDGNTLTDTSFKITVRYCSRNCFTQIKITDATAEMVSHGLSYREIIQQKLFHAA